MFAIIGILVVFGAVVGGYLMEHGNLKVLLQPAELLIIGGAGAGTVLVANPLHILKKIAGGLGGVFGGSKFTRQRYLDSSKMMYDLLNKARRDGLVALETDIEDPEKSPVLSQYPAFLKDHHVREFVCDTMRMAVTGGIEPYDVDQMMEADMDVHHHGATQPIAALSTMADSLPGLGNVAAVLGVVITMGALGGPPEEIGEKVAAALVGTFLGILLCYGLVGPVAANMAKTSDDEHDYYQVMRVLMLAFLKGISPIMAVEIGRRAIPGHVRPSFQEVEQTCRGGGAAAPAEEGRLQPRRRQPERHRLCVGTNPSSLSRRKAVMGGIMEVPGKSLTLTSSRR
jgi:chemotaxis protein MotA